MPEVSIEPLPLGQLHTVYPLVREVVPGLDLQDWLRFARHITGPKRAGRSGIVVARRAGRSFPSGLFCYRAEPDLQHGTMLVVDYIVALDILDPRPIVAALVSELDALARRLACTAIHSVVRDGSHEITIGLLSGGHRPEREKRRFESGGGPDRPARRLLS